MPKKYETTYTLGSRIQKQTQREASVSERGAKLKAALRRARTNELIETGALATKAGLWDLAVPNRAGLEVRIKTARTHEEAVSAAAELSELNRLALYGGFLTLQKPGKDEKRIAQWIEAARSAEAREELAKHREPMSIKYPLTRDQLKEDHPRTFAALAEANFKWDRFFEVWISESAEPVRAYELAVLHGGELRRKDGTLYEGEAPIAQAAE